MVQTRSNKRKVEEQSNSDDSSDDESTHKYPTRYMKRKKRRTYHDGSSSEDSESDISLSSETSEEDNNDWIASLIEDGDVEEGEDGDLTVRVNYAGVVKLLKSTSPECAKNLEEVMSITSEKTPTFMKLLQENLDSEHRCRLLELLEALKILEAACTQGQPCRLEYLNLRDEISRLTQKYKKRKEYQDKLSKEQQDEFNKQRKKFQEIVNTEHDNTEARILGLNTTEENKIAIYRQYQKLERLNSGDDEKGKLNTWLEWATSLPYNNISISPADNHVEILSKLANELDKNLHGMLKVKEQILTFVSMRLSKNSSTKGDVLALSGPPGTGKTSIARLLTNVLTIPFTQISFGGIQNSEYFTGHDFTYVGSRPGEIARCMRRLGKKDGVIFMDEFEKVSKNKSIIATLLHIIDKQQNSEFRDNYLRDITIDLSSIWFICSMNSPPVDSALKDRLFIIDVDGYTKNDKKDIIIKHSFPKALKEAGLSCSDIIITEETATAIVELISPVKSGVREIESTVKELVRKISFLETIGDSLDNYPFKISFKMNVNYPFTLIPNHLDILLDVKKSENTSMGYLYT